MPRRPSENVRAHRKPEESKVKLYNPFCHLSARAFYFTKDSFDRFLMGILNYSYNYDYLIDEYFMM